MSVTNNKYTAFISTLKSSKIAVPIVLLCILAMVILPLSPIILDILFTFNIVLAILVLLVGVNSERPLDFAVFPSILLITTLLRLCLNVASARVVLLHGHEGTGAAGSVIESFGQVVIGGNFIVGFVVFIILMIINFIVVTKGAERISEVSARFTLDALPGKQMSIDADLNAGLITQEQAKARRREVAGEADFYGAMDGASKFVRGDAIAGIMILAINVIGGICIGLFKYNLPAGQAFQQYVLLTIGDGLVAQIPSLLLSTAAAIIVTRVSDTGEMSNAIKTQLLASPNILFTAAFIMFVLAIVPGMPHIPFFIFTALLIFVGWQQSKRVKVQDTEVDYEAINSAIEEDENVNVINWHSIPQIEPIGLNLGYKLISLIDKEKGSPLAQRIKGVRQVISENFGILLPEIRIRENFRLKPNEYSIFINGVKTTSSKVHVDRLMAIPTAEMYGEIDGILDTDPAYGIAVTWISAENKSQALNYGYQVVDCSTVIATHINKIARQYLPDLFNYDDIKYLHERLAEKTPKLAEDLTNALNYTQFLKVYRQLLLEDISLKDIVTIATTLLESSTVTKDHILLTSDVRYSLRHAIIASLNQDRNELAVATISQELENLLLAALSQSQQAGKVLLDSFPVDPNILNQLQANMPIILEQMKATGHTPILSVTPQLRPLLSRYARLFSASLHVISYNEIPDNMKIKVVATLN